MISLRRVLAGTTAFATVAGLVAGPTGLAGIAGAGVPRVMVPIGSDYQAPTMQLMARTAAARDTDGTVSMLVLPITYSLDPISTTKTEVRKNLTLAENRRGLLQDACDAVRAPSQTCDVRLVPVLVRADAYLQSNLDVFTADLDGMFVLGGDQTVAMGVVAGTPLEERMAAAFDAGAVLGGNSAGDAVQSVNMINGFNSGFDVPTSLRQGAVDVWTYDGGGDLTRGLVFGLSGIVDEQHVYERGRIGRALNVAAQHRLPVLGMDAATGGVITDQTTFGDVAGATSGIVIDPVSFSGRSTFAGPNSTLSARNIATHLIPPGSFGFDFATMRPTVGGTAVARPSMGTRAYPSFTTPAGAGRLLLTSTAADMPTGAAVQRFVSNSGGRAAQLVVVVAGYARSTLASSTAKRVATALQGAVTAPVQTVVLGSTDSATALAAINSATGIFLTAPDQATLVPALAAQATVRDAIRNRWVGGAALLADDAAASAMGTLMPADKPPTDVEVDGSLDFVNGYVQMRNGLGWVRGLTVTSRVLTMHRWGQMYRMLMFIPSLMAVGLDTATAIEVSGGAATVIGDSAAVVLDGRWATFGTGSNSAISARYVMVDTFVDGERLGG